MKTDKNAVKENDQNIETSSEPDDFFSAPTPPPSSPANDYLWQIGCFAVTIIACFWRFWQLELKPLHHDEGVNSYFLKTLFTDGVYKYDPSNYHGPTLYYIALAFTKVFGLETVPIRASVAIFGVLTVVLVLYFKKYLGS